MSRFRYLRQEMISGWDQSQLENKTVVIVGAGALGNHVAPALAALGIGTIKIVDYDKIEKHNLNRQFMFTEADIGRNKAEALAERVSERNSEVNVIAIPEKITEDNVDTIIGEPDAIIDCVDLIHVRKILNEYALEIDIPLIHGGISWDGWEAAVLTRDTACVNCIYPESLQKEEEEIITSCIEKPEASVVYTSQMCAAFMTELVRRVFLPLEGDGKYEGIMFKYSSKLDTPMYTEKLHRKENCDLCLPILKDVAPDKYETALKEIEEDKKHKDDDFSVDNIISV